VTASLAPPRGDLHGELRRLGAIAFLLCGDVGEAEDAAAEAVARVLQRQAAGELAEVGPYLRRTLVNVVARRQRRRGSEARALLRSWSPTRTPAVEDTASDRSDLRRALDALPMKQRSVVVLRFLEDLTEQEVAEVLGLPIGTVKSRTARALAALRPMLTGGSTRA
jgi:RNA polymerase sigma factor (sigma-70 family)